MQASAPFEMPDTCMQSKNDSLFGAEAHLVEPSPLSPPLPAQGVHMHVDMDAADPIGFAIRLIWNQLDRIE